MSSMQHCIEHKSGISAPLSWPSLNGDKAYDYLVSMAYREPGQLLMTFEDTEKAAASKIRQRARSKELFEFVRRSTHSIAVFDPDMCYLMASKGWLADFHLDLPAILGESHYDVFPEIGPNWRVVQQVCLTGGIIQKEKELFLHHDGQMDWMRWEVHPWRHVGGQIGGILIQAERVDLQEDSVALFKYQFENAPDIILIINDQLCIETINRGLEQGQPASKLLG